MYDLPQVCQLKDISKFDASFFGVSATQANKMDPSLRILLEVTYEAIVDSGVDPSTLRKSDTGVYVGAGPSQFHFAMSSDDIDTLTGYEMTGSEQCMLANRLSNWFDLRGPSIVMNTACSSSLVALDQAVKDIRKGLCEAAIVAGVNIINHPGISKQLFKLGLLSPTGRCASFDEEADGYCRSEGIVAILIQKKEVAKRIYCDIIHSKVNNNGSSMGGVITPSKEAQCKLLQELYEEANVNPANVFYIEAHATGTQTGDKVEAESIAEIFCKERGNPLFVGSVKSNLGHTENASGLVSIAKVVIAMEAKQIPKNLHFNTLNSKIHELHNGKLAVVQENLTLNEEYIGVNNFGFGGTNVHVLLKTHYTRREQSDSENTSANIILYSSRDPSSVKDIMGKIVKYERNFHALLMNANLMAGKETIRAYSLGNEISTKPTDKPKLRQQIWFIFSGMGVQWRGMGKAMMEIWTFRESILKSSLVLSQLGINLMEIMQGEKSTDNLTNTSIEITAIQMALFDVLSIGGIKPDGIIGHSVGELACAYADGCLTRDETLLIAYKRVYCISNADLPDGAMAAIGLSLEQVENIVSKGVVVACHNAKDSVTISGSKTEIDEIVKDLKAKGVFAKHVNTNGIAFHSNDLQIIEESFRDSVKQVLKCPKLRSNRWISTVVPDVSSDCGLPKYLTIDYLTKSFTSPVLFYEATKHIPIGATVIEIAPHCLLQPLLRRSLSETCYITGLMTRGQESVLYFMSSLGKLYERGIDFNSNTLGEKIPFPVPTGTPMISPVVKWDHGQTWDVPSLDVCIGTKSNNCFRYTIDTSVAGEFSYFRDHKINGRIIFPASGYIYLAWKSFAKMIGKCFETQRVKFNDVEFHHAVILQEDKGKETSLEINISQSTGRFEVYESNLLVTSGYMCKADKRTLGFIGVLDQDSKLNSSEDDLQRKELYKELSIRGYDYGERFQSIESSDLAGQNGKLRWSSHWEIFIDAMLQYPLLSKVQRGLYLPRRLRECLIIPESKTLTTYIPVQYETTTDECKCPFVQIRGLTYLPPSHQTYFLPPLLESYKFVKNTFGSLVSTEGNNQRKITFARVDNEGMKDDYEYELKTSLDIVLENSPKVLHILDIDREDMITNVNMHLSKHVGYMAKHYRLNSKTLHVNQIRDDTNHEYGASSKDLSATSDITNNSGGSFHLILCSEEKCSVQTISFIENNISKGGFILLQSSEPDGKDTVQKFDRYFKNDKYIVIHTILKAGHRTMILFRKKRVYTDKENKFINVSLDNLNWVREIKIFVSDLKQECSNTRLWLISEEECNGLLGLMKCLICEHGHDRIRCIINQSEIPIEATKLDEIIKADLVFNVINPKRQTGSYRHVPLKYDSKVQTAHGHIRIKHSGNLSSLQWVQSTEEAEIDVKKQVYTVCYSALNFRDVMLASGKLKPAANPGNYTSPDNMLGMEFSGFDKLCRRVMGVVPDLKGISTSVLTRTDCVWSVPDEWTLEQAASVPMAYLSALLALVVKGNIAKGESILIHSGSGGLGQAAIAIALSYECVIFTTVGSVEKKKFLLEKYPKLEKSNIFSSRDTDFEQKILMQTNGAGVDIVLNSLAGDILHASVRVLNSFGRFLEMGKYDLFQNSSLGMQMFLKNASFHGVHLDFLLSEDNNGHLLKRLSKCFTKGISDGIVQPLNTTVFDKHNVEEAFRHMIKGKHTGKVLIKMLEESEYSAAKLPLISAEPKVYASPSKWYIITGGLGGIGLELAEWLSDRGARALVLTSRTGVRTGYQRRKLSLLRERGVRIEASIKNVSNMAEAESLLQEYKPLGGIFHLAMVLKDGVIENQDETTFRYVFDPKAQAAIYLDKLTRHTVGCDWFICFSSIASGRGNAGQTNYGYANSVVERICESRKRDGLHGLAIQFGPICQTGIFHETMSNKTSNLAGAVPQNITSCLATLEILMNQPEPVVSCFVPEERSGEKRELNSDSSLVSSILKILGIEEQQQVCENSKLNELGLDSLTSIEVRQLLERLTETPMSVDHVQNMTVKELKQISNPRE